MDKIKINFSIKKTEYDWQKAMDRFFKKATPLWFEFLEWLTILGFLSHVKNNHKSVGLEVVIIISNILLWFYLQACMFNISIEGVWSIKARRFIRVFSLVLGAIILVVAHLIISNIISILNSN